MTKRSELMDMLIRSSGSDRIAELFPTLAEAVEAQLNGLLRIHEMWAETNLTLDSEGKGTLPDDFISARFVLVPPKRFLKQRTAQEIRSDVTGYHVGALQIQVYPVVDAITVGYWAKLPSVVQNDTNAALERGPNLYFTGMMAEYYAIAGDVQKTMEYQTAFDALVRQTSADDLWDRQGKIGVM